MVVGCVTASVTNLTVNRYEPIPLDSVTILADVSELEADSIGYERVKSRVVCKSV